HPAEYAEKVAVIHGWAKKTGRDPHSITLSFRAPIELVSKSAKPAGGGRPAFRGDAAPGIPAIKEDQAPGGTRFIFDLPPTAVRGQLAMMERFADEVRPKTLRAPR